SSPSFNANDLASISLQDPSTVAMQWQCNRDGLLLAQVATFLGSSVQRGSANNVHDGQSATLAPRDGGTAVGYSWSLASSQSMFNECLLLLRADVQGNQLSFSRGLGDAQCDQNSLTHLDWEVVDFGPWATSAKITVNLGMGTLTSMTAIAPADR